MRKKRPCRFYSTRSIFLFWFYKLGLPQISRYLAARRFVGLHLRQRGARTAALEGGFDFLGPPRVRRMHKVFAMMRLRAVRRPFVSLRRGRSQFFPRALFGTTPPGHSPPCALPDAPRVFPDFYPGRRKCRWRPLPLTVFALYAAVIGLYTCHAAVYLFQVFAFGGEAKKLEICRGRKRAVPMGWRYSAPEFPPT